MSNLFTTTASTTTFNFPIFISGSNGQTWYWDWTTGTGTVPTLINPTPFTLGTPGTIITKKIMGTDIDYIDFETVFKVKKGRLFKLFDFLQAKRRWALCLPIL